MTYPPLPEQSFLYGHADGGVWDKAGGPTGDDAWNSVDLGHGIYVLEVDGGDPGGALGLLVGDEGSVLINTGASKAAAVTLAATERLAGGPVDYLITTHLHADHVGCNADYAAAGATIISHEETRRALLANDTFDNAGLPVLTFQDRARLHLNGLTLDLIHFQNAHTASDIIVHFVEANVIHAGDLFFNRIYPFIDLENGGTIDGFIAAQRQIIDLAEEDTQIIAGYGPVGSKDEMRTAVDILLAIKATMEPLIDGGMSMEEVLRENPLSVFEPYAWFHIPTAQMTKMVFRLLTEKTGPPIGFLDQIPQYAPQGDQR